jgi:hypothetical protein
VCFNWFMATLREKLESLLNKLSEELLRGYGCWQIAQGIGSAQAEGNLAGAAQFISTVQEACMREAYLSLAKLGITEGESITIEYLLNVASQVPSRSFPLATREGIDRSVATHRGQLEQLAPVMDDLKLQRDRVLAHLDRKHINEPEAVAPELVETQQIEVCFHVFLGILNTYRRYFGSAELSFEKVEADLRAEVGYVVRRVGATDDGAG